MKKIFTLLVIGLMSLQSFSVVTLSPANLNGVNDTARCQHSYYKSFSASGSIAPYHFTVVAGSLPVGCQLDSVKGLITGIIGYSSSTSINFTIKARSTTTGVSGTQAYTLYIRNTVLTAPQLTDIWSKSSRPRSDVYDTWFTTYTNNNIANVPVGWSLTGNTVGAAKKFGTIDNYSLFFYTNNINTATLFANGSGFDVRGGYFLNGTRAMYNMNGSHTSIAIGNIAGGTGTGNYNTLMGSISGNSLTTGTTNSLYGYSSGSDLVAGNKNTFLGANINVGDVSNNIILADGDGIVRMRTLASGYTGFGTATPTSLLFLKGSTGLTLEGDDNGFGNLKIKPYSNATTYTSFVFPDNEEIRVGGGFGANGSKFRFMSSTNVARMSINKDSPQATLEVHGESSTINYSIIVNNSTNIPTFRVRDDGRVNISAVPHDSTGLAAGDIYVGVGGVLKFKY